MPRCPKSLPCRYWRSSGNTCGGTPQEHEKCFQDVLRERDLRIKRLEEEREQLEAYLREHFEWRLSGYNGPDYIENATESFWFLMQKDDSVKVEGSQPPGDVVAALRRLAKEKHDAR